MRSLVLPALLAGVALGACSSEAEERIAQSAVTPEGSCAGACGTQSADGCWCDAQCDQFGDCCADKVPVCDGCPPVLCTLFCEHGFVKGPDGCETCSCNPPPVSECENAGGVCRLNSPSPCAAGTMPAALSCEIQADVCCVPSNPPPLDSSCQGHCGSNSGTCWCDDQCEANGDCCADKAALCDPEPCGNTTCAGGESCQFCWGSLQCIPDGAQC